MIFYDIIRSKYYLGIFLLPSTVFFVWMNIISSSLSSPFTTANDAKNAKDKNKNGNDDGNKDDQPHPVHLSTVPMLDS